MNAERDGVAVIEVGLATGYLMAWAMTKFRRVGAQVDGELDDAISLGLDHLHGLVMEKLGSDPALGKLQDKIRNGEDVGEVTRRRVADALIDAAEEDPAFAAQLTAALDQVRLAEEAQSHATNASANGSRAAAVGRDVVIQSASGSVSALTVGDINLGRALPVPQSPAPQLPDPQAPDRSHG